MAARQGLVRLPQNSLIELTHYLADFLSPVLEAIKLEILNALILHADETPHRMLESIKKAWYLWGFSSEHAALFQVESSRSGDVAADFLIESSCEVLVSDVYSAYAKATRLANEHRQEHGQPAIINAYCNAHSRRKFRELGEEHSEFFVERYQEVYALEAEVKNLPEAEKIERRQAMEPHFHQMKQRSEQLVAEYSSKSSESKAAAYFLNNFEGFTACLYDPRIKLDNNSQEALLRNPVIGRKTWYGNHSIQGAKTTAALFSIIETCKMNKVNPREYFPKIVKTIHEGKKIFTPNEYRQKLELESKVKPPPN